jgi:hypothetical protein
MDRYDIMMPRLLPAEASKPRLYQPLVVTAGIILTCYGLLTAVSSLLPILRERIEANRAGNVTAFRDRIIVHLKPTAITMTPRPTLVLPTAPVPTVETVPQSYALSSMRRPAVPVSPEPMAVEPIRPKLHPKAVVLDSDPGWYVFVPPGDASTSHLTRARRSRVGCGARRSAASASASTTSSGSSTTRSMNAITLGN